MKRLLVLVNKVAGVLFVVLRLKGGDHKEWWWAQQPHFDINVSYPILGHSSPFNYSSVSD